MGKVFRRLICFFLGLVTGAVTTVGGVATSVYYMYSNVTVQDVVNTRTEEIGDLNDYSIEDIVGLIKRAVDAPDDYTFRDFEEKYGVDFSGLLQRLVGDNVITQEKIDEGYLDDLKSISLFSLFSSDGLRKFLSDIPVGAALCFVPDELISAQERTKLRRYSIGQLFENDEYTGTLGLYTALRDINVGGLLPTVFDYDPATGKYEAKEDLPKALNLIANVKLGAFIDSFVNQSSDIMTELVEGGLSSIGDSSLGDILGNLIEDEALVSRLDGLFNGIKIRELFTKNSEGQYEFTVENLTDNIKIGGLLGYTYDADEDKWYTEDGTPATGVLDVLASLDATTLYLAATSDAPVADKIKDIILAFGDLAIEDVFETMGFEVDDEGNLVKDDTVISNDLITSLLSISVEDIVGPGELSVAQITKNLLGAIGDVTEGMTLADAIGEFMGVERNDEGKLVYTDDSLGEINPALEALLEIGVDDFFNSFTGEEFDYMDVVNVFRDSFSGMLLGDALGFTKENGVWYDKDGNELDSSLALVSEIDFAVIFNALDGMTTPAELLRSVFSELTLGDFASAFIEPLTGEGVGNGKTYTFGSDENAVAL